MTHGKHVLIAMLLALAAVSLLPGCTSDDDSGNNSGQNDGGNDNGHNDDGSPDDDGSPANDDADNLSDLTPEQINDSDGQLSATIRYTTGGVPHILATNLESAGFGTGYAQARSNACVIADQIIRVRGERAKYYGSGPSVQPPLPKSRAGVNIISDFSLRALGLLSRAQQNFDSLSAASQAVLRGFAAGYNRYLEVTDNLTRTTPANRHGKCAGKPWVKPITPQELLAYYELVALYASGMQFATGATFFADPGSLFQALPNPQRRAGLAPDDGLMLTSLDGRIDWPTTDFTDLGMGSNGWGIGGDMTESGRGALLANPHFPYTGSRRLYQMHITVPGVYNVNGAGLIGIPAPLIGFNQSLAWTHTVSTANHFTVYTLQLAAGNELAYIKDGQPHAITTKTIQIEVQRDLLDPLTLEKTFYFSEYGPLINLNLVSDQLPKWGEAFAGKSSVAFSYRDANIDTAEQVIDQWLQMGMADNLTQFKQAFTGCSSVLWVNTMYADADGNAFYIDATSVPKLSTEALRAYAGRVTASAVVAGLAASGVTLLDGSTSRDDWIEGACGDGLVRYPGMPKLTRGDYVQNSNDSYWATNLSTLDDVVAAGYSPLFGPVNDALSPRTRMGLDMLMHPTAPGLSRVQPAGGDGKFSGTDIMNMLYSNRAYYAELLLDDLLTRCQAVGANRVTLGALTSRRVEDGCNVLADWDGVYNVDSVGAHVFRVFIGHYDNQLPGAFTVPFDPNQPATTPRQPPAAAADLANDPMLMALAQGLEALDRANIAYDAKLGDVQYVQQSTAVPPGERPQPAGNPIPWHGTQNIEGGFNIVSTYYGEVADGTRYPRVAPREPLPDTGGLSKARGEGWQVAYGTSWHFGLMFTDDGPEAWGLLSYSQSVDSSSPHFADQDQRYSAKDYRELLYSEQEISNDADLKTITIEAADTTT